MRCPSCNVENPKELSACEACGTALTRRSKRRSIPRDCESPFAPCPEPANRGAFRAYKIACYGLIPGLGLLLGPVSAVLGGIAQARGKANPEFTAHGPARAAIVLGFLISLTNWVGLVLMVMGLQSLGG